MIETLDGGEVRNYLSGKVHVVSIETESHHTLGLGGQTDVTHPTPETVTFTSGGKKKLPKKSRSGAFQDLQ